MNRVSPERAKYLLPLVRRFIVAPFQGRVSCNAIVSQGVALGCHVAAPSGRKTFRRNCRAPGFVFWTLLVIVNAWSASGCAGGARRGETATPKKSETTAETSAAQVTPSSKASWSLDAVEPVPTPPAPGAAITALSERGAVQIAAAKSLMAEQRFTEAALELERALRYDPQHPEIHRALAQLHHQAGNRDRARTHIAKALELCPDDGAAYYLQGRNLQADGEFAGAITAYRTALLCPPDRRGAEITLLTHYHLAEALQADGYATAALEQFAVFESAASQIEPATVAPELAALIRGAPISMGKARSEILEVLHRPGEAADALTAAVEATLQNLDLAIRRAKLLTQAGRLDDALAAARAIAADSPEVLQFLAEIHTARGSSTELVSDLQTRLARRPGDQPLAVALADLLARDGRSAEAEQLLRRQLELNPEAAELRPRLVDLMAASKRWNDALTVAADGIARDSNHEAEFTSRFSALRDDPAALQALLDQVPPAESAQALYLRGVLARDVGRWELARRLLEASTAADTRFVSTREALARMYFAAFDYDQALSAAGRRDPEVAEDPRLEMLLGDIFERLDDADLAEFHYNAAIQLDKRRTAAMMQLAGIYSRTDRALQAQRQLRALLDMEPQHEAARETLAFLLLKQGKVDAALQQFHELKKRAVTPAVRARSEVLAAQYPRVDAGAYRHAMVEAMRDSAPDAASWLIVAESYDENTQWPERSDAFAEALRVDPENEEAAWGLLTGARRMLRFDEVARRLNLLLPRRPNRHAWRFELIDTYWTLQQYDQALALAEKEAQRPDLDEAQRTGYRLRIVDSLRLAGRKEESLSRLKEWADASGEREWKQRLAEMYLRDDQAAAAVAVYESLYQAEGSDKSTLNELIEALGAAKRYDRAVQYALEWLAEDPNNDRAVALAAFALSGAGRADDTLELVRAHLAQTLHREFFQDLLMRQLRMADRYRDAAQWIESLLDAAASQMQLLTGDRPGVPDDQRTSEELIRRPNEPFGMEKLADRIVELRRELAQTHMAARDFAEAERLLLDWLASAQSPRQKLEYLRALSACYQAQAMDLKSTEVLEQMLALAPGHVGFSNDLAYGWIDRGMRMVEAERLIRHALASAPREGAYLDTFGWLLYKKGEFSEAKKWLEMASRDRQEEDPVVLDHLGDTLWRLGEKEEAIARWEKAAAKAGELKEEAVLAADLRRVRAGTARKAEDARAGRQPQAAALAENTPAAQPDSQ